MWQTTLEKAYARMHHLEELLAANIRLQKRIRQTAEDIEDSLNAARAEIYRLEAMTPEEAEDE